MALLAQSPDPAWYSISVSIWAAAGAGVISVGAATFTGMQWWEARKARQNNADALAKQADDLRRSSEGAERSSLAAEASAKSAEQLVKVGQRAWVY